MSSEKTKRELFCFLLSISLLFFGGLIYLNFRPHTLFLFSWLKNLNLESFFEQKSFNSKSKILSFCIYSLPNALWSVSAIILFGIVWEKSTNTFLFYSIGFTLGNITFEILQFFKIIPGTFDFMDILVLLISLITGIFIYKLLLEGDFYEF